MLILLKNSQCQTSEIVPKCPIVPCGARTPGLLLPSEMKETNFPPDPPAGWQLCLWDMGKHLFPAKSFCKAVETSVLRDSCSFPMGRALLNLRDCH